MMCVPADPRDAAYKARWACSFVLLVLPWLNPFAPGPSPSAGPLMVSWVCASLALGLGAWRDADLVARAWLAAAAISAVFGLMQYFGAVQVGLGLISATEPGTAFANLRQRNQFATLLAIGLIALLHLIERPERVPRRAAYGGAVLLALAAAASASRTGALELFVIAGLCLAWRGPHRAQRVALSVVALLTYLAAIPLLPRALHALTGHEAVSLLDRASAGGACGSRLVLWSNVIELIRERPLAGWGIGELDYAHYAHLYGGARFCDILDNAHNLPLHVAVEGGLPLAIIFVLAVMAAVLRLAPWRERDPARRMAWGVLCVLAIHSMLEYPLWYGPFQFALVLSVLLLVRDRTWPRAWRAGGMLAAFVLVPALLAYAAWDYHRISQLYLSPEERSPRYREDTLAHAQKSLLFRQQVKFAELGITPLTRANAADIQALSLDMLHFSPEPMVIERVIDSSMMLRDENMAHWHMRRYRAAFPDAYARWLEQAAPARAAAP